MRVRAEAEKEMTTGWQFATQINDDEDMSKFEVVGQTVFREKNNQSAILIADRAPFPSMLDPAFEDDFPSPKARGPTC
jgi:hypothetical protein